MEWKLPPREKVYEAFSVIADSRYEMISEGKLVVTSSGREKKYTVTFSENKGVLKANSDDNASKWQGYIGYPIIAMLLIDGRIHFNNKILKFFKGIPWSNLNKIHKNNYPEVVEEILNKLDPQSAIEIRSEVENIYDQIRRLKLNRK